jgi:hypothetical protein
MFALQNNRRRYADMIAKQVLRAHVDQLTPAKQREFIAVAFHLIARRTHVSKVETGARYWSSAQSGKQQDIDITQ